jgi:hypothetical protein
MAGLFRSEGRLFSVPSEYRGLVGCIKRRSTRPNEEAGLILLSLVGFDVLSEFEREGNERKW